MSEIETPSRWLSSVNRGDGVCPGSAARELSGRATAIHLILVLLLAAVLRLPGLFAPFGSEYAGWSGPFYAIMARNCLAKGTFVPLLNPDLAAQEAPVAYANHPPSAAWTIALSFVLLGESEFAARLPFYLCSLLSVFYAYRLGRTLGRRNTGIVAALFLATCPVAIAYGHQPEIVGSLLLLGVLGATLAHVRFWATPSRWTAVSLVFWSMWLLFADWPGTFLFFLLQMHAFLTQRHSRRRVLAIALFGTAFLILVVLGLASLIPEGAWAHFVKKIHHRSFHLETDQGQVFDIYTLGRRYILLHWELIGPTLLLPCLVWLILAIRSRFRGQAIAVVLVTFGFVFLAIGCQGFQQHDWWLHPLAAGYALAASMGLALLSLKSARHLVALAYILALVNATLITEYKQYGRVLLPHRAEHWEEDCHRDLKGWVSSIVAPGDLVVVAHSSKIWPTLPYYLGRRLAVIDPSLVSKQDWSTTLGSAQPWQAYLMKDKLVLSDNPKQWLARRTPYADLAHPRWLLILGTTVSPVGAELVAGHKGWFLYRWPTLAKQPEAAPPADAYYCDASTK